MNRLLAGARRIEIDVLDDLGLDRFQAWRRGLLGAEIDLDHPAAVGLGRRRERRKRTVDPACGGFGEV